MTMMYLTLTGALYAFPLIALMAAAGRYHLDQPGVGATFGVPPSTSLSSQVTPQQAGDIYMTVAGIRVFFLGANIVVFALLRDRRATGVAVAGAVLVPLLDGLVVWGHAKKDTWLATAIASHWGPAALAAWLA
ncbi:hypothetical protein K438DRAFT_1962008 [Mycena galopus ATCC 62051]|nr:hypothetical protein K438DRAFT_1962008 [Mycena galopus ATCC 62051]